MPLGRRPNLASQGARRGRGRGGPFGPERAQFEPEGIFAGLEGRADPWIPAEMSRRSHKHGFCAALGYDWAAGRPDSQLRSSRLPKRGDSNGAGCKAVSIHRAYIIVDSDSFLGRAAFGGALRGLRPRGGWERV